jgi:Protein required for attachment to host cells
MELVVDFKTHKADIPTIGSIVIGITSSARVSKVSAAKELGLTVAAFNFCGRWDFELNDPSTHDDRSALGMIRPEYSPALRRSIVQEIAKDLVKQPVHEIEQLTASKD